LILAHDLIGYYLPKILELAGLTSFTKIQAFSSGFYAWLLVVGVIAAQLVERLGRRRLLMISLWGLVFTFAMFTALSVRSILSHHQHESTDTRVPQGSFAKTGNLKTGLAALVWIFLTGACESEPPVN